MLNRHTLLSSLHLLLRAHLEQLRRIHAAALLGHAQAHKPSEGAALIIRRVLHGLCLRPYQMRCRHVGVAEDSVPLKILDHILVFFRSIDGIDTKRHNLYAAQVLSLIHICKKMSAALPAIYESEG